MLILHLYFSELEGATPFTRKIQPDELWLYKNPRSDSYVPTSVLWVGVTSNCRHKTMDYDILLFSDFALFRLLTWVPEMGNTGWSCGCSCTLLHAAVVQFTILCDNGRCFP